MCVVCCWLCVVVACPMGVRGCRFLFFVESDLMFVVCCVLCAVRRCLLFLVRCCLFVVVCCSLFVVVVFVYRCCSLLLFRGLVVLVVVGPCWLRFVVVYCVWSCVVLGCFLLFHVVCRRV